MKAYITATGSISPQETRQGMNFPEPLTEVVSDRLTYIEPDYRGLINPLQLRRMPRILKMGLGSAQLCINRSGGLNPDAIIVGTGLGCLENLEKFLLEVLESHEHITSVLPFINSTHNAVAAHIAMLLHNHGYNLTYCHRGLSFESALDDALMLIEEKKASHVLVGGIDECTADFMHLHSYLGYWKKPTPNLKLLDAKSTGTLAGEGATFFMLSAIPTRSQQVAVEGVHTFLAAEDGGMQDIIRETDAFLQAQHTGKEEVELLLTGMNGDSNFDFLYAGLKDQYFPSSTGMAYYKHLCGEYYTSSAFALWLASMILSSQAIPSVVQLVAPAQKQINKILIYNHFRNREHALILLSHGKI
jgi:3-oxoacyl-[acyl-carrier-protein] synthase II